MIAFPKKKSEPSIKKLEKKLRAILYPLIKKRDGNICISCQSMCESRNHHAGHFIKAELCNLVVRYDVRNINSQCGGCNVWKRGNPTAYRKAMLIKYGQKVVEELEENYNKPAEVDSRLFLNSLITRYKGMETL